MKKVALITTSRADWSGLGMLGKALQAREVEVQVASLSPDHPTWVADDGLPLRLSCEQPTHFTEWDALVWTDMGLGNALVDFLSARAPDLVVICGDRHEALIAAYVAAMRGSPIVHLSGGDVTGGSLDEGWRHAITKIAHVHFPTHHEAAARILRMGENPQRVHVFGSPAIDRLLSAKLPAYAGPERFILANWQPETPVDQWLPAVLAALDLVDRPVVFVGANADQGGQEANRQVERWAAAREHGRRRTEVIGTMPANEYLAALRDCLCLVGNSSSGFYEAPYFGTPVVNIGDRQRGRTLPKCVTLVTADADHIAAAIRQAIARPQRYGPEMLYGNGLAAEAIAEKIDGYLAMPEGWHRGKMFRDDL